MRKSCKLNLVKQIKNEVSPVLSLTDFDPSLTTYIRYGMALVQCMDAALLTKFLHLFSPSLTTDSKETCISLVTCMLVEIFMRQGGWALHLLDVHSLDIS
jgi:hypothetical protein